MNSNPKVTRWPGDTPPTDEQIQQIMRRENLPFYTWSNSPGDVYAPHSHSYHKVLYVAKGSITFGFPETQTKIEMHPGDRLDLPPGIVHDAIVGSEGVVCIEGHRYDTGKES
ncbi:hypothetical protein Tter_0199 [Thermobaculum terrenum ATCC BAA-798]|uniref:AraC-type arabinose-binding/dimerisation domain-containing protein n=1 Tax=Thermobaculum terrenum (strain ATCC BAA-798 / CCMEE 7001 / YNP1) TaxID=525904 RepID=D1CDW5_THET1|nr:AraC family ligand binding domain-containing protein [Thermobaculum terrenum]ACZ41121.1 hypothetical protein Tter_0199 [Thermobaculum terrenum ATCC BAA-798]